MCKLKLLLEINFIEKEGNHIEKGPIPIHVCNSKATNQYVDNIKLLIKPNPVQIKPSKTLSIDFGIDVLKDIPSGASVSLKLKKHEIWDITIPCLNVSENCSVKLQCPWF